MGNIVSCPWWDTNPLFLDELARSIAKPLVLKDRTS
jgi:hypothetical protein